MRSEVDLFVNNCFKGSMKYNHLLVKFEFHALVATRPSASKLMMKAPDIKVCKVKAVVFRNGNCCLHLQAKICIETKA